MADAYTDGGHEICIFRVGFLTIKRDMDEKIHILIFPVSKEFWWFKGEAMPKPKLGLGLGLNLGYFSYNHTSKTV
uniref:Uncharacterized protein n=1 Tax=Romanomermis culicivorax TaxID=13658 RepID=A0A915KD88_ROMCU